MSDPIERAKEGGRTTLTEAEAKELLADAGIAIPESAVAETREEAVEAAEEIGYPVVAKIASPAVTHKSEWGDGAGVQVGLADAGAVRAAADRILSEAEQEGIEADVFVEEAADLDAGTEVIVGGLRDPSFGPTVLVGLGGVFTEVFEDVSHRLAPLDADEAREALEELKAMKLLRGFRDHPAADVDALAETVATVGDIMVENEEITEIDVNPVLATGEGATALDALVVIEE